MPLQRTPLHLFCATAYFLSNRFFLSDVKAISRRLFPPLIDKILGQLRTRGSSKKCCCAHFASQHFAKTMFARANNCAGSFYATFSLRNNVHTDVVAARTPVLGYRGICFGNVGSKYNASQRLRGQCQYAHHQNNCKVDQGVGIVG